MKTEIVQQGYNKTTIEYSYKKSKVNPVTNRFTKIQVDSLIQGSVVFTVNTDLKSFNFISKTNVVNGLAKVNTIVVKNPTSKTFLSCVTNLTIQQQGVTGSYPLFIQDTQPNYSEKYLWIQTNYMQPGDFTFWFEDKT